MYEKILAVTDRKLCLRPFPEQIRRVCGCRPKALVLREKDLTPDAYRDLAEQVLEINFDDEETKKLRGSAEELKSVLKEIGLE